MSLAKLGNVILTVRKYVYKIHDLTILNGKIEQTKFGYILRQISSFSSFTTSPKRNPTMTTQILKMPLDSFVFCL